METQEEKQTNKQTKVNYRVSWVCLCSSAQSGLSNLGLASLLPCLLALCDTAKSRGSPGLSVHFFKMGLILPIPQDWLWAGERHGKQHWTGSQTQQLLSFPRLEDGAIPGETRNLSSCGMLLCRVTAPPDTSRSVRGNGPPPPPILNVLISRFQTLCSIFK